MSFEPWTGPEEVRVHLGFERVETIYRLCQRGLPHVRIGRNLRFKLSQVDAWVEAEGGNGQAGDVVDLASRRVG